MDENYLHDLFINDVKGALYRASGPGSQTCPPVTEADNGKFLGVANGEWTAVSLSIDQMMADSLIPTDQEVTDMVDDIFDSTDGVTEEEVATEEEINDMIGEIFG